MQAGVMLPAGHVPSSMITMPGGGFGLSVPPPSLGQSNMPDDNDFPYMEQHIDDFLLQAASDSNLQNFENFDNRSNSGNIEGVSVENSESNRPAKKKRYHRHTQDQIQELERIFLECPHPDDKQRKEMSRSLGLRPTQIKFWFQNKRTQTKNQHERQENTQLRSDNERLRAENTRFKEALGTVSCHNCDGPASHGDTSFDEHQLGIENARLREEIERISGIAANYLGKQAFSNALMSYGIPSRVVLDNDVGGFGVLLGIQAAGNLLSSFTAHTEAEKPMVIELAVASMDELLGMVQMEEPLWIAGFNSLIETLNEEEYMRAFPRGIGPKPLEFKTEATRDSAIIIMGIANIVEILMDANRWSAIFSGIVSRATTLEVFSTGVAGNYDGAMQVMTAEYHLPSPLVPTRESLFVRYCKQHSETTWAIVDVSLDSLHPDNLMRCRRRASGCLIEAMDNGLTKVIWVEHVELDDRGVHDMYKPLVDSGLAFGAKRWLSTLDRQCERLTSVMSNHSDLGMETSHNGWKGMLKLAERMVSTFFDGVTSSPMHDWSGVSGTNENVRVTSKQSRDDPGRPHGVVMNAATSFWLPVPMKRLFDFLRHQTSRNEWDLLSRGGDIFEMAHIDIGQDPGNCLSVFRVNNRDDSTNGNSVLILQENCSDSTGAYIVYAPVDLITLKLLLNGGDPDFVALLSSGFAVFPDGPAGMEVDENGNSPGGSLLTVSFQILIESVTSKLSLASIATVNNLINCTVGKIKTALGV